MRRRLQPAALSLSNAAVNKQDSNLLAAALRLRICTSNGCQVVAHTDSLRPEIRLGADASHPTNFWASRVGLAFRLTRRNSTTSDYARETARFSITRRHASTNFRTPSRVPSRLNINMTVSVQCQRTSKEKANSTLPFVSPNSP